MELKGILGGIIADTIKLGFNIAAAKMAAVKIENPPYLKKNHKKPLRLEPIVLKNIFSSELEEMTELIEEARTLVSIGKKGEALEKLTHAKEKTSCNRCAEKLTGIIEELKQGKDVEKKLRLIGDLVRHYYEIKEKEPLLKEEEECEVCLAEKIARMCNWNSDCIEHLIHFANSHPDFDEKMMIHEVERYMRGMK